jgi:hypothetical protein
MYGSIIMAAFSAATLQTSAQATGPTTSEPAAQRPNLAVRKQAQRTSTGAELLTNESIIALVKAGIGPDTIVAKIGVSKGNYDTTTNALISLKQAGVPDRVIAAMLDRSGSPVLTNAIADDTNPDPLVPHSPGIYLLDERVGAMVRLNATSSNQVKTSNYWGFALTAGLSSMKKKLVIPNTSARIQVLDRRPTFYFYFGKAGMLADLAGFNSNVAVSATSPNEFSLVRLEQKQDHREVAVGSINIISRVKSGVSDKARVPFTYDEIAPGVFRVTPGAYLEPGEYGFVSSVVAGADRDVIARIFDFSVN